MNTVLYYPGFEIDDINWLKFALLYVRQLRPIIPRSGERSLSEQTMRIKEETDLFDYYRPNEDERYYASDFAFDIMEKIVRHPSRFLRTFKGVKPDQLLQDKTKHTFLLYQEKTSFNFREFCLQSGYATENDRGMLINPILGNIYMTILANVIAERNSMQCITDIPRMDTYNIITRESNLNRYQNRYYDSSDQKEIKIAKSIIQTYLPNDLKSIDLKTIIDFRKNSDYINKLDSFHREINRYLTAIEESSESLNFEDFIKSTTKDLRNEIAMLTSQVITVGIEVWSAVNNDFKPENIITATLTAGNAVYTGINVRKLIVDNQDSRFTRKYLTSLKRRFHSEGFRKGTV